MDIHCMSMARRQSIRDFHVRASKVRRGLSSDRALLECSRVLASFYNVFAASCAVISVPDYVLMLNPDIKFRIRWLF